MRTGSVCASDDDPRVDNREATVTALADDGAQAAREMFARTATSAVCATAQALSFLPPDDTVRGLALVTDMGGSLACGVRDLLDTGNAYSAAALLRQVVEVEYLWWTFADDAQDAARWLHASRSQLDRHFKPAKMRERSSGRFRAAEYKAHCDQGGHPNPAGRALLSRKSESAPDPARVLWLDLCQHLSRGWGLLVTACAAVDRQGATARDAGEVAAARAGWLEADSLAP
jgi:hypothetical protein